MIRHSRLSALIVLVLMLSLLTLPAAAQQPRVPETAGGAPPPLTPGVPAGLHPTAGPLLYKTSLDIGDAGFSVYDPATDTWTQLTPYETGAQMAVSGQRNLYAYGYATGTIDVYDPAADTWSAVIAAPPGATGQYGNLEITANEEFLYTEPWGNTLWYTVGWVWNTMTLPFNCDAMGDYEPASNQYVIGEAWTTNAHWIDLDTWAITDYYSPVGNGEYARFSVVMDNMYFFEAGGSPIHSFDLGNPSAPPVDTGVTLSSYSSASADRFNHTIYVASLDGTQLWLYDVPSNSATPLTGGSAGYHSSLAFVDTAHEGATLHLGNIAGQFRLDPYGRHLLRMKVLAHDEGHNPVGDVAVDVRIEPPAGGSFARTRMTRPSGWATFPWGSALPGHWQLCVDNLTKPGYTYDPAFNDVPECASWDN